MTEPKGGQMNKQAKVDAVIAAAEALLTSMEKSNTGALETKTLCRALLLLSAVVSENISDITRVAKK